MDIVKVTVQSVPSYTMVQVLISSLFVMLIFGFTRLGSI